MENTYTGNKLGSYGQVVTENNSACVTLLSYDGKMYSMWLPPHMEGRYKFSDSSHNSDVLSFFAEAKNGNWILSCANGSEFYTIGKSGNKIYAGTSIVVENRIFYKIDLENREYTVYVEFENEYSNVYIPYYVKKRGEIRIGRLHDNDICYSSGLVSRNHAVLRWDENRWEVEDSGSLNGVYVNRHKVQKHELNLGDMIWIMGLQIIIGVGFIEINNLDNRAIINSSYIRQTQDNSELPFSYTPAYSSKRELFKRQPRKREVVDTAPIEIEMPPMSLSGNSIPLLLRMGSPMVMGGRAAMSGNIAMMLTSLVFPLLTNGYSEKEKKEYETKRLASYTEYLKLKENEINNVKRKQENVLKRNYPTFHELMGFVNSKKRLWERRKRDDDFLSVRLGTGQIPLLSKIEFQPEKMKLNRDPLEEKMYQLVKQNIVLNEVPIMLSLKDAFILGIEGSLSNRIHYLQMLISQIAIYHSYDEVKIVVLVDEENLDDFDFARYIPHCWDDDRNIRFIGTSKADAYTIGEHMKNEIEEDLKNNRKLNEILKSRPYYIVFALDKSLYDSVEFFKEICQRDDNCGVSIVAAFENIPVECQRMIELFDNTGGLVVDLMQPEIKDQFFSYDAVSYSFLCEQMKELSGIKLRYTENAYILPKTYTFLEMFNAGKVEHLNPLKRWNDNNPVKTLATPVGIGTDGELFYLDLHEKHQGPHGLVAGMTGSGKSEFIITYILSMAVNYSPDEVAFVLIDYKGGGLATSFEDERRGIHLPHLVGTITNLDGSAIQRALMSIKSELKRRQAVFNEAKSKLDEGTMDIYTYQQHFRKKNVTEPMPHLFIISDEFAELKQQQPEFMNELISTARIGRSLGVHLILATQKPSGVVNDQIISNTKFRVCLKVQGKQDSIDMLKRPEAAELKDTGRFYLQVGYNEFFAMGQSAWCGAEYFPQDEVSVEVDNSVKFVDLTGQKLRQIKPKSVRQKSGTKQLVAIVRYLSEIAKREGLERRKLWIDPVPPIVELETVENRYPNCCGDRISALMGIVDDPERQTQYPFVLDLQESGNLAIVGTSGSGKTTFLRTLLYSLVERYSPADVNYYIMDFASGALGMFRTAPHCGAVVNEQDDASVDRLLNMIRDEIAERKRRFNQVGVSNFESYRKIRNLPYIYVIIDNYTQLMALNQNKYTYTFHEYLREGGSCGVKFIVTVNNLDELSSRAKIEINKRVALKAKDKFTYADILRVRNDFVPANHPGRGMCVYDGRALEFQTAIACYDEDEQKNNEKIAEKIAATVMKYAGYPRAAVLPVVREDETYKEFIRDIPDGRIPLGYDLKTIKKISIPLAQLFSMSVYFGDRKPVYPIMKNFMTAFARESMMLVVVANQENSGFEEIIEELRLMGQQVTVLRNTKEDSVVLANMILGEINKRKVFRNEFFEAHHIPLEKAKDPKNMKQAAPYVRRNSEPYMVIFESLTAFRDNMEPKYVDVYKELFKNGKGYNMYYTALFYPQDKSALMVDAVCKVFNPDDFLLFFGGNYHQQGMTVLPREYQSITHVPKDLGAFVMKYHDSFHTLRMPYEAVVEVSDVDADELPII